MTIIEDADLPSIHNSGEGATAELQTILEQHGTVVRGPRSGPRAATVPDISFTPTGTTDAIAVEVKKAGKSVAQMRPISYMVTAVWRPPTSRVAAQWWIIPPDDLLRFAAQHAGQHCVSSFECMNPGPPTAAWDRWACERDDIATSIVRAHTQGQASHLLNVVRTMIAEIQAMFARHRELVLRLHTAPNH